MITQKTGILERVGRLSHCLTDGTVVSAIFKEKHSLRTGGFVKTGKWQSYRESRDVGSLATRHLQASFTAPFASFVRISSVR